ncbi:conserved Plasmodium protein, unknown function [Plasmodium malariae]|uniref:Uncharacterized protein n=1 Tax=Plasmodium malariae TaxID=5858 RepID=A0A1C3L1M1_PLAMA|nr:conserved Plasmodium protein, unknown function [Plasmodium malariae]
MNDNNEEKNNERKIRKKNIDILFDSEEMEVSINKMNEGKHEKKGNSEKNKIDDEKNRLLIFNNYLPKESVKSNKDNDGISRGKENVKHINRNKNTIKQEKKNSVNDDEFEIPIHFGKRSKHNDFLNESFYKFREYDEDDDADDNKKLHIMDIFNYHDFPVNLFGIKKKKAKNRDKKFVIEFVDSYNDEFVKKNINNNIIFESIGVCKGISFLDINENININCLGVNDNNAFYFYKMIPFNKIYSQDAINKILTKKNVVSKIEHRKQHNNNDIHAINYEHNPRHNEANDFFIKNYNILKNYFFKKKKEKKTIYNDLYLSPYEKNLKSSLCIGTHIYSQERAVKKCFGLLIEQNVYSLDQPQDDSTAVNKNLENLYFDFPFYKNQIIFKPIYYPYKNVQIISNSFRNYFKNIQWEKFNNLKDVEFYYDIKNNLFNFSKDVYLTTKSAIRHFDSPKDFVIQTANRVKDINIHMKKICEKSFYIIHNSILKLSKVSKSS